MHVTAQLFGPRGSPQYHIGPTTQEGAHRTPASTQQRIWMACTFEILEMAFEGRFKRRPSIDADFIIVIDFMRLWESKFGHIEGRPSWNAVIKAIYSEDSQSLSSRLRIPKLSKPSLITILQVFKSPHTGGSNDFQSP